MGKNSAIEWTDHTFNPWWGCSKVSPACDFCYAETFARRVIPNLDLWQVAGPRRQFGEKHWNEPLHWNRHAEVNGTNPRVFCASMADVFDKNAPDFARPRLWNLIKRTHALRWLLLTKRIGNARAALPPFWWEMDNAALGITVVNQPELERDYPKLLALPAAMRFLSIEPMLGEIDFSPFFLRRSPRLVDWIIVGGESGPHARPLSPRWVRSVRDQCKAAGVAFFFKQWGEWAPSSEIGLHGIEHKPQVVLPPYVMYRIGKKSAGRTLDGETHSDLPTWRPVHEQKETFEL